MSKVSGLAFTGILLSTTWRIEGFSVAPLPPAVPTTTRAIAVLEPSPSSSSVIPSSTLSSLRLSTNILASATLAPAATLAPTVNQAGPSIFITDINYNGNVPRTEADEYVALTNGKAIPLDVSGYYLYVATNGSQGSTFTFPKGTVLKPSASVRIYTNEIHKESGGYSFGSGKALWNNRGGLAVLKDSAGKKLGEFKYKGAATESAS